MRMPLLAILGAGALALALSTGNLKGVAASCLAAWLVLLALPSAPCR